VRDTSIRVLGDRVLLRADEAESTQSGILLPESAQEKPQTGVVVAVGEGKRLEDGTVVAPDVAANDHVFYGKYGGNEVTVDGEEMILIDADMIYAKITD